MTRIAALAVVPLVLLLAQTGGQAAAGDALPYARGFLVTGNYRVGGVDFTPQQNPADINGFATGEIRFNTNPAINKTNPGIDNTVPAGSEIVAAFLYWEAVYVPGVKPTEGVEFRGNVIDPGAQWGTGPLHNNQLVLSGPNGDAHPVPGLEWASIQTLPGNTSPCWGAANQTGNARLTMFKFDVLHLLPKLLDANNNWTGRRLVNDVDLTTNYDENGQAYGHHTVRLPEGSGDQAIQSAGAALVVVYRRPDDPSTPTLGDGDPLTKIVMYDGVFTGATMTQTLRGFFQHTGTNVGRLTQLVGTGGNNQSELLFFNGSNKQNIIATNSFPQTSPSSDRSWAFPTYQNLSMNNTGSAPGFGGSAITTVNYQNANPQHCSTWGGIIFSTPVLDADQDGLPDALEASSTSGGFPWRNPDGPEPSVADPNAQNFPNTLLPDLNAMGARTGRKDILVEVNALSTISLGTMRYGDASAPYDSANNIPFVDIPEHTHLPFPEALKLVGDAFLAKGIHVHFDVGKDLAAAYAADIAALAALQGTTLPTNPANKYIATSELAQPHSAARGGETLLEPTCTPSETEPCHFQYFSGTVGYKFGLELIRNAPVKDNGAELTSTGDADDWDAAAGDSTTKRRRFDALRSSLVHYSLYAHARGRPKAFPCVKNGFPTDYPGVGNSCSPLADNPAFVGNEADYHVPSSSSGVGDLPGGNFMVTLGLWDALNGVGTPYNQAATTFHELGHNLNLWHGGLPAILGQKQVGGNAPGSATFVEPQCKPNHQTTMSYMFQGHGLITVTGDAVLDYSDKELGNLNEASLADGKFDTIPKYRPTWFAPAGSTLAGSLGVLPATRLCNGVKFQELNPPGSPSPAMARVWAPSPSTSNPADWDVVIDWNGDTVTNTSPNLNVNFDGIFGGTQTLGALNEVDDWARIRLDQIGAATNVVVRRLEGGPEDPNGVPTLVSGDTFGGDTFGGDTFGGDTFGGDTFGGDTFGGDGEVDSPTVRGMGRGDARALDACVLGGTPQQDGCTGPWDDNEGNRSNTQPSAGDAFYHKILLRWFEATSEPVDFYTLTQTGGGVTTTYTLQAEDLTTVGGRVSWVVTDPPPNQLPNQFPDHVNFTFTLVPTLDDGEEGPDYQTTIAGVNDWPLAVDRLSYTTPRNTPLVRGIADGLIRNDTTDSDSPAAPLAPPQALLFASVETPPPSGPGGGTVTVNPDGSFTFTPHPNTRNQDVEFTFRVSNSPSTGVQLNSNTPWPPNPGPVADRIGTVKIRVTN
jgi:Bacterial Ig domain